MIDERNKTRRTNTDPRTKKLKRKETERRVVLPPSLPPSLSPRHVPSSVHPTTTKRSSTTTLTRSKPISSSSRHPESLIVEIVLLDHHPARRSSSSASSASSSLALSASSKMDSVSAGVEGHSSTCGGTRSSWRRRLVVDLVLRLRLMGWRRELMSDWGVGGV